MPTPAYQRVLAKTVTSDVPFQGSPCWIFVGYRQPKGYGVVGVGSRTDGTNGTALAHRVVYESFIGAIPDGLVIDHLCRVRSCVNPLHMETVTAAQNTSRGSRATTRFCLEGHEYTSDNTIVLQRGWRSCRACAQSDWREYRKRKRASA